MSCTSQAANKTFEWEMAHSLSHRPPHHEQQRRNARRRGSDDDHQRSGVATSRRGHSQDSTQVYVCSSFLAESRHVGIHVVSAPVHSWVPKSSRESPAPECLVLDPVLLLRSHGGRDGGRAGEWDRRPLSDPRPDRRGGWLRSSCYASAGRRHHPVPALPGRRRAGGVNRRTFSGFGFRRSCRADLPARACGTDCGRIAPPDGASHPRATTSLRTQSRPADLISSPGC